MKKGMGLARVDLGFNRGIRPARVGWDYRGEMKVARVDWDQNRPVVPSRPRRPLASFIVAGAWVPRSFFRKNLGSFSDRAVLRGFCRLDP